MVQVAVMLVNMGAPDSLDSVKPYLFNLFSDAAIIDVPIPGVIRRLLARLLANRRYKKSINIYKQIGGKSPLSEITDVQCQRVESRLNRQYSFRFRVFPTMRYWHPKIEDVWHEVVEQGFSKIVILPLYPFYSITTSQSIFTLIDKLNQGRTAQKSDLMMINSFGNHPQFIEAIIHQIETALESYPDIRDILLSAHSIPMKSVKKGDLYLAEITMAFRQLNHHFNGNRRLHLSFQSKLGPLKWLAPSTIDKISEIAAQGVRNLMVYPFGFVSDNSETVYELDIQMKKLALEKGILNYIRVDALNDDDFFIETLHTLIMNKLNEAET